MSYAYVVMFVQNLVCVLIVSAVASPSIKYAYKAVLIITA